MTLSNVLHSRLKRTQEICEIPGLASKTLSYRSLSAHETTCEAAMTAMPNHASHVLFRQGKRRVDAVHLRRQGFPRTALRAAVSNALRSGGPGPQGSGRCEPPIS